MKKLLSFFICLILMNAGTVQAKNTVKTIIVNQWNTVESKEKNSLYYVLNVPKDSFVYFNWQTNYSDLAGYRTGALDIYSKQKKLLNTIRDNDFDAFYLKKGSYYMQYHVRGQRGVEAMKSKLKLVYRPAASIPAIRWKHQYQKNVEKGDVMAYKFKADKKSYLKSQKWFDTDTHLLKKTSKEDENEEKLLNKGTYYIFNYASKKGKYEYKADLVPVSDLIKVKKYNTIKNAYNLKINKTYAGRTTEKKLYFKFKTNKTMKLTYTSQLPSSVMVISDQYVAEKDELKRLKKATAVTDGEKSTFTVKKGTYYLIVNGGDSADYPYFQFKLRE